MAKTKPDGRVILSKAEVAELNAAAEHDYLIEGHRGPQDRVTAAVQGEDGSLVVEVRNSAADEDGEIVSGAEYRLVVVARGDDPLTGRSYSSDVFTVEEGSKVNVQLDAEWQNYADSKGRVDYYLLDADGNAVSFEYDRRCEPNAVTRDHMGFKVDKRIHHDPLTGHAVKDFRAQKQMLDLPLEAGGGDRDGGRLPTHTDDAIRWGRDGSGDYWISVFNRPDGEGNRDKIDADRKYDIVFTEHGDYKAGDILDANRVVEGMISTRNFTIGDDREVIVELGRKQFEDLQSTFDGDGRATMWLRDVETGELVHRQIMDDFSPDQGKFHELGDEITSNTRCENKELVDELNGNGPVYEGYDPINNWQPAVRKEILGRITEEGFSQDEPNGRDLVFNNVAGGEFTDLQAHAFVVGEAGVFDDGSIAGDTYVGTMAADMTDGFRWSGGFNSAQLPADTFGNEQGALVNTLDGSVVHVFEPEVPAL